MYINAKALKNRIQALIIKNDIIILFIIIFIIYNINLRLIGSHDTVPASLIPFNMLEYHNLELDHFFNYFQNEGYNTYFLIPVDGHFLSMYPIVTPILITPLYVIPYIILKATGVSINLYDPFFMIAVMWMEKLTAAVIASASGIFVYLSLKYIVDKKTAVLCTLAYAFASDTWVISSQSLWQQGMTELLLSIIIFLILRTERKYDVANIIMIGFLSGLFIFNRPPEIFLLLPVLAYIISLKNKSLIYYTVSTLAIMIPFLVYNYHYFGNLLGGYSNTLSSFVFNGSIFTNFLGLLISPSRGLFIYTPIALFSLAGISSVKKIREGRLRIFLYASAIAILLQVIEYSCYPVWWAGWSYGPRYLTGILPLLVIFISLSLPGPGVPNKKEMTIMVTFILLLIISVCVQAIGAFCYNYNWDAYPVGIDYSPGRLWDITDMQITRSLSMGRSQMTLLDILDIKYDKKGNVNVRGTFGTEQWGNISTQWVSNISNITFNSPEYDDSNLTFTAISFNKDRTMRVYLNDRLAHEQLILRNGSSVVVPLHLKKGFNNITIIAPDGGQSPSEVPEYNSNDSRILCFALQRVKIE